MLGIFKRKSGEQSSNNGRNAATGLEGMAGKFDPEAARRARAEKRAQMVAQGQATVQDRYHHQTWNGAEMITSGGVEETSQERIQRQQGNILRQNVLGNEQAERAMIDGIAGNWNSRNGSAEKVMGTLDAMREQKILAYMTGLDMNDYATMGVSDVRRFVRENPSPIDFERKAEDFLQRLERANNPAKRRQYEEVMKSFKHKIYGKKQEYWEAMKALKDRDTARLETTWQLQGEGVRNRGERRAEWMVGSNARARVSKGQVRQGLVGQGNMSRGLEADAQCEDAELERPEMELYGVFDGAGGVLGGRRAANVARATVDALSTQYILQSGSDLAWVLNQASAAVANDSTAGYTTGVLTKIINEPQGRKLAWASAGDSRIYVVGRDGKAQLITKDEGIENRIWNCLGLQDRPDQRVEQFGDVMLKAGDRVVLCSDGVTGDKGAELMSDEEVAEAVQGATDAEQAAQELILRARKADDRTAIVVQGA